MKLKKAFLKRQWEKICDFKDNNLHVLGYSSKINKFLKYESLIKNYLFFKKKTKFNLISTSYYKRKWGFSLSFNKFKN